MKKYLFGLFAIALAIGLNSFAPVKKQNTSTNLYWFEVNSSKGSLSAFTNADAVIQASSLSAGATSASLDGEICSAETEEYKCVIGFDPEDVNSTTGALLDNAGQNPVTPVAIEQIRDTQ